VAKYIMTDAYVSVAGNVISNHVESVEITVDVDDVDITSMGATAHEHAPGLRDDGFSLNLFQDFAAGSMDQIFWPLVGSASGFAVECRPASGTVTSVNPKFTATCILLSYSPIAGKVGEASQTKIDLKTAAGSSIVRATA